jgi:uncharacterized membrane protein
VLIDRQIQINAPPRRVLAALTATPHQPAIDVVPDGSGSRVLITARIEPDALGASIESEIIAAICRTKRRLESPYAPQTRRQPHRQSQQQRTRKSNMTTVTRTITIDAPRTAVWRVLADFGNIATWNPNVKTSALTSDQPGGLGATRQCHLLPMGEVNERITAWEEERIIGIDIIESKKLPAMRSAVANFELRDQGTSTAVKLTMSYTVGLGPIGASMNALMMKRQFGKVATQMMAGLKHHVETGELVTKKTKLPLST